VFGEQKVSDYDPFREDAGQKGGLQEADGDDLFGRRNDDSDDDADFIDDKNEIPLVREIENNDNLSKLAPSFQKLEELYNYIELMQEENVELEKNKNTAFFGKTQ